MAIRVALHHHTTYRFSQPTVVFPHVLRLRPAPHCRTKIHSYSLTVQPKNHFINWQQDPFGNFQARLVFPEPCEELSITVEVQADLTAINPFDFFVESYAERVPFAYEAALAKSLEPYLEIAENGPLLQAWVQRLRDDIQQRQSQGQPWHVNDFLVTANQQLQQHLAYAIRLEPGVQTCEDTLRLKQGSCRDSAWLLVQIFRHLGYAARFASGYLVQLTADVKSLDGPSGPDADFTDLHAWAEVYIPGAGWLGLDPTSGLMASEGHIPLACTPSPSCAAPITGATGLCEVAFSYSNQVFRIHEDPRVTKPYSEDQWAYIQALGEAVDAQLVQQDVRLTCGGEPTFVSIDDMESAQWNTDALGAEKLTLAKNLLIRLRNTFAPQGLLHYGQGKWYPGEEVPRWALGLFWRTDGQPLWRNPKWLARVDGIYGLGSHHALHFAQQLCARLGVNPAHVIPAFEDALYFLWAEQQLPPEANSLQADLGDSLERQRLARVLGRGLNTPAGYVLPIEWNFATAQWQTSPWPLRSAQLNLIPGDSPLGLRLPLNSLDQAPSPTPLLDPFAPHPPLAPSGQTQWPQPPLEGRPHPYAEAGYPIRTALCCEVRQGRLHIFLPPLSHLEHFVALIEALEDTAQQLAIPIILEGYEPPKDFRLKKLLITPDPGVIEVNIHPVDNWRDLVANTLALYEDARQVRLGTEKFMLDGRHSGTGGGNHITFGGPTPADSPFLRRPDLLRSLITYWQHHPGLSYLFSGLFIGPTSQAPRVDEGRDALLYELEIAFAQMPSGTVEQPWLIDRLLRNLLIDITGNTHRAEFCIDKLYAPGHSAGRQGLLEFRGF